MSVRYNEDISRNDGLGMVSVSVGHSCVAKKLMQRAIFLRVGTGSSKEGNDVGGPPDEEHEQETSMPPTTSYGPQEDLVFTPSTYLGITKCCFYVDHRDGRSKRASLTKLSFKRLCRRLSLKPLPLAVY